MDFELNEFLPYKLSLATNTVSHALAKEYAQHGVTRTQWRVLAVLGGAGEMTAGAIAKKTMMDKTTLSRSVNNLISRDLVRRRASQSDGRASPLVLTQAGRVLFARIVPIALAGEKAMKAKLSAAQCRALETILDLLLEEN